MKLIHIFEGKEMKTHLHVGDYVVGRLLSPCPACMQSAQRKPPAVGAIAVAGPWRIVGFIDYEVPVLNTTDKLQITKEMQVPNIQPSPPRNVLKAIQQTKLQCKSINLVPFYKKHADHDRHHPRFAITGVFTRIIKPDHTREFRTW